MDIAVNIISKIPGDGLKIGCLILGTLIYFLPLFFVKKRTQKTVYEMLMNTKLALEIKKLVLEMDDKSNREVPNRLNQKNQFYFIDEEVEHPLLHDIEETETKYYNKIKFGMLGSFFFFFITGMAMLISSNEMNNWTDYVSYFSKEIAICLASGFIVTFIPWGNEWNYFLYGFAMPILIAINIALITT